MKLSASNSNNLLRGLPGRRPWRGRLAGACLLALLVAPAACERRTADPTAEPAAEGAADAAAGGAASSPEQEPPTTASLPAADSALGRLPGGGQQVRFNLGQSAEYFTALTAFEVKIVSNVQVQGGGGPTGETQQELSLRQGLGQDFEIVFAVKVGGGNEARRQSGFTAVRKGDFLYFRAGQEKFFRNRATPEVEASRYVGLEGIRSYLNLLQSGSTFSMLRSKYLDRPVRIYRLVASLPLSENPAYDGPPPAASSQQGEVWVDEASGLVLKSYYRVKKEGLGESGEKVVFEEKSEFVIARIGDVGEIEAPKDYFENTEKNISGAPRVPLSVEGGEDDRNAGRR